MLSLDEFSEIVCDYCKNETIIYVCPLCESKSCFLCFNKHFFESNDRAIKCKNCGGIDRLRVGFVNEEKKL